MCLPLKVNAANDIQMYIQVPLLLQIAKLWKFTNLNKSIWAQKKGKGKACCYNSKQGEKATIKLNRGEKKVRILKVNQGMTLEFVDP